MTSVAASVFASLPTAPLAGRDGADVQATDGVFGALLGGAAPVPSGGPELASGQGGDAQFSSTAIAALLVTASAVPAADATPVVKASAAPVAVAARVDTAPENFNTDSAAIVAAPDASATVPPLKAPAVPVGQLRSTPARPPAILTAPLAESAVPAPADAIVSPPSHDTSAASAPATDEVRRSDRPKADEPVVDTTQAPTAPITTPFPPAALATLVAPPPAPVAAKPASDARSHTVVSASTANAAGPGATAPLPAVTDQRVVAISGGRGESASGQGDDTSSSSHHAAAPIGKTAEATASHDAATPFPLASLHAPTLAAARPSAADIGTITAQPGRIGQELGIAIAHHVANAATGGGDTITLRLNPVNMGRIEVKLSFDDRGTLRAVVSADNPAALDMLRRDSADLGRALTDAGVRADTQTLRFDTRAGSGQTGGQSAGQGGDTGQPWQRQNRPTSDTAPGAAEDMTEAYRPLRTRGRVDMVA